MAAHGGARNRSGRKPGPGSERAYSLTALPAEGYAGPAPEFPLPSASDRELELWEQAWRTPQACAWSLPSESWRQRTVAMWVRLSVRAEDFEAPASLIAQVHRFADQIGMTTAGLAEMGWKVAVDEVAGKAAAAPPAPRRERRLRAVGDAQ